MQRQKSRYVWLNKWKEVVGKEKNCGAKKAPWIENNRGDKEKGKKERVLQKGTQWSERKMEGRSRYILSRETKEPQKDERVAREAAR